MVTVTVTFIAFSSVTPNHLSVILGVVSWGVGAVYEQYLEAVLPE